MVDEERVAGLLLDGARNSLAVLGAEQQRAEDQQVERALEEGDAVVLVSSG